MIVATAETVKIDKRRVACDGGGGALGHPTVYLEMGRNDRIDCPYCGRHFVYQGPERKEPGS
ncbi:MAG: hypothetical protein TEF_13035 [Rhizobiales bacterium NRL2]|jgi:uncharacterized Zn-finger protein|nr:MAG: hypothetical protein TEF_13035 [Rhizobiales bacterium NRL2]